ncbi:MAG: hypothetical protein ABSH53_20440 [Holophaga sp.]|jgi:hypothetical protein
MHAELRAGITAILFSLGTAAPLPGTTPSEVLARAKAAHGGSAWDRVGVLVMPGSVQVEDQGEPLDGETWEDLAHGRYLRWYGSGEALRWWSFDGKDFRMQNGVGGPSYLVPGELRDQVARTCAYMHARGYWYPGRFPAAMADLGLKQEEGATYRVLLIKPRGALPLECWLDADQGLVSRVTWTLRQGTWRYTFADYREVAGLKLPFLILCGWEGEPGPTRIQAREYRFADRVPAGCWTRWCRTPDTAAAPAEAAGPLP